MQKMLLVRVHGMKASPKFGLEQFDRDDEYIQQKRAEQGITGGRLIHEVAPCRTDQLIGETVAHGMILTKLVQIMAGPKKTTPVLYATYSNEGAPYCPNFRCGEDELVQVQEKFKTWSEGLLLRSWGSGRLYQNPDMLSVAVVEPMKLNGDHAALFMTDLLDELEQQASA